MTYAKSLACLSLTLALAACNGDDGTTDASATDATTDTSTGGTVGTTTMGGTTSGATTTMGGTGTDSATMGTSVGTETVGTTATTDTTASTGTTDPTASTSSGTDTMGVTDSTTGGPVCGDGNIDAGEACDDGNDIAGDGCEPDCTVTPDPCGNGALDDGEACDGDMFAGETDCKALDDQYSGGTVSCAANCQLDYATCEKCEAPGMLAPCDADAYIKNNNDDILHAMELACNTADAMFSDPNKHIPVANYMATNVATGSWRVAKQFGTYLDPMDGNKPLWRPRKGDRMLIISSGNLPAPNAQGIVTQAGGTVSGGNPNPDNLNNFPGVMKWQKGSNNGMGGTPFMNCDGTNDCSDTLFDQWNLGNTKTAHDVFYMQFNLTTPKGTYGYVVDFAYFSSEYPVYVNTQYNDMAIIWQVAEDYTGNVTFITDNNNNPRPLSVTALAQNMLMKYTGNAPQLQGTGFVGNAGTGWVSVKGPAKPQETFTLAYSVFDKADGVLDTLLLVDNWQWDCEGCVPSEVDSCGVQPQ